MANPVHIVEIASGFKPCPRSGYAPRNDPPLAGVVLRNMSYLLRLYLRIPFSFFIRLSLLACLCWELCEPEFFIICILLDDDFYRAK